MLKRIGVDSRLDLAIFLSLVVLVAITPLGNEATHPIVLGIYRTLLLLIIFASALRMRQFQLPHISLLFLSVIGIVIFAMYGSAVLRTGSHFDGVYTFYQNALFLAAFISLASFNRTRTPQWKAAILSLVVVFDLVHLATAWVHGTRPLLGPFVNANYFASYLVVGFAGCVACGLWSQSLRNRIVAAGAGLILLYGIGQTSSRGAFVSVLALLCVALYRAARQHRIAIWRVMIVGTLAVLLIGAIAAAVNPSLVQKFSDRGQGDPYNYQRTKIWMKSLSMIATYPVLGVGLGRFYYVSKIFTPAVEGTIGRYGRWSNIAHSEYLQYAAELGVPVALLIFAIGGYLFRQAWQRANTVATESRIFQEAAILAAVGLGVHALVDNNWTVPVVAAGLAVISLADMLPYNASRLHFEWTPVRIAALGIFVTAIFVQGVKIPVVGLYFNEAGHQAYIAGNFQRAEQMHRLAVGIIPDHPMLIDNLGMVYFDDYKRTHKIEYLDRAEILFQDSIAANPSFDLPAGHLENVLFQRLTGNVSKDQPIHTLIVATDRQRLRVTPYNPFVRKNLGEALYNMGEKHEAIMELQKAIELEPNYVQAYTRLAQWNEEAGRVDEAKAYREKAINIVIRYKDQATTDPFENMLLDRPTVIAEKP